MKKRVLLVVACISFLFFVSCARDALKNQPQLGARLITISFTVRENLDPAYYYFFLFNFTNSPSQDDTKRPYSRVSGPDRGRNWEEYIIYSPGSGTWGTLKKQVGSVDTDRVKWTDNIPFALQNQSFYVPTATASGATLSVTLDPQKFTDVYGNVPANFILDFITASTPIDRSSAGNPNDLGVVLDWLVTPEIVQVTPGFQDNNQRSPLHLLNKNHVQAPAPADIVDWTVQVT